MAAGDRAVAGGRHVVGNKSVVAQWSCPVVVGGSGSAVLEGANSVAVAGARLMAVDRDKEGRSLAGSKSASEGMMDRGDRSVTCSRSLALARAFSFVVA